MTDAADHTAERIRHLEMIQGVIARMAGNSAAIKRYAILAVAVGVAIYGSIEEPWVVVALAAMVAVFWALDARYLQQERWFRNLYDQVRGESEETRPDFRLTPDATLRAGVSFRSAAVSWSTAGLYAPLLVILLLF